MEQVIITIYINKVPFRFNVHIDKQGQTTTYHVSAKDMGNGQIDAVPEEVQFNVDGKVTMEAAELTVKQEQTARLIWLEILKKLNR